MLLLIKQCIVSFMSLLYTQNLSPCSIKQAYRHFSEQRTNRISHVAVFHISLTRLLSSIIRLFNRSSWLNMKALGTNRHFPAFTALSHNIIVRRGQTDVSYKHFPFLAIFAKCEVTVYLLKCCFLLTEYWSVPQKVSPTCHGGGAYVAGRAMPAVV